MGHFGPKDSVFLVTLTCSELFFLILHNERGQEVMEIINGFSEKILIWGKWAILGPKMMCPHNSGSSLRIF